MLPRALVPAVERLMPSLSLLGGTLLGACLWLEPLLGQGNYNRGPGPYDRTRGYLQGERRSYGTGQSNPAQPGQAGQGAAPSRASTGLPLQRLPGILPIGGGTPIPLPGLPSGPMLPGTGLFPLPAGPSPQPDEASRWPSWVEIGGAGRSGLDPELRLEASVDPRRLLLVRFSDLVHVHPHDETAFYPLRFWDKLRVLAPGAGTRIEGGGRAVLLFSDGCRIDALQEFEAWFTEADGERLEIDLVWVTHADVRLGQRRTVVWLPDGSELTGQLARFTVERTRRDAPWMQGGTEHRLAIRNWGPGPIALRLAPLPDATGVPPRLELAEGRRSVLPIVGGRRQRAADALAATFAARTESALPRSRAGGGRPLETDVHTRIEEQGGALELRSETEAGAARWGGVELRIPAGRSVRLDPIGGTPFRAPSGRAAEPEER